MDSIEGIRMGGRRRNAIELRRLMSSGGGGGLLLYLVMMLRLLVHPGGSFLGIVMLAVHWVIGNHLEGGNRPLGNQSLRYGRAVSSGSDDEYRIVGTRRSLWQGLQGLKFSGGLYLREGHTDRRGAFVLPSGRNDCLCVPDTEA